MNLNNNRTIMTELSGNSATGPAEGFLVSSGANIHYLDWQGNGKETHFLHANGFCSGTYTPLLKFLAGDFLFMETDSRGHVDSDPPALIE